MDTIIYFVEVIIQFLVITLELMGALVISYSGLLIFIRFCHLKFHQPSTDIRLRFARALALGLEFQLGGEILRTISVRDPQDLLIVGALVLLRGLMTLLIHWEIDHESRSIIHESQHEA